MSDPSSPGHNPVSIVVPTFREAANIPTLVRRVSAALSDWPAEWELILVDDDSNDGSEAIVAKWGGRLPVRMVTRRGATRDLSLSVLEGMRLARCDRLVVMDADLSHPPEQIIDLLAAFDADCDMVVGSRYVPEARMDPAWSLARALLSRAGTLMARPLADCRDPLSGFFATDRRRLPDLEDLHPVGYKIALELMARGRLRVREVPIRFGARHRGTSKLNWRTPFNFLRHLSRLYGYRVHERVRRTLSDRSPRSAS
ncbi:MAG: polyprenol monophosphomannose synthase [Candidatus Aminicenantes bacterium]|nr:polyprenol monophosphomannose synthase [Candidatus Aminicenantes bacterium]